MYERRTKKEQGIHQIPWFLFKMQCSAIWVKEREERIDTFVFSKKVCCHGNLLCGKVAEIHLRGKLLYFIINMMIISVWIWISLCRLTESGVLFYHFWGESNVNFLSTNTSNCVSCCYFDAVISFLFFW